MRKSKIGNRWVFVLVLFLFLFFHQIDVVLLGPLAAQRMTGLDVFDIFQDPVVTVGLLVGISFYLVWGYLYDSHSRKKLVFVVGILWGMSSWLMGIAPTYATFVLSYAIAGIDNASYSGFYALIGDYFSPRNRGKVLGLLFLVQPFALFVGSFLSNVVNTAANWRSMLMVSGAIGFILAFLVYFFFREPKRGAREPALVNMDMTGTYLFDWHLAKNLLRKPVMLFIYGISLLGVIPWFVITIYLFPYLNEVHSLQETTIYLNLFPSLIALTLGYPLSGLFGDILFRKMKTGRILVSLLGATLPSLFLILAFRVHDFQQPSFIMLMMAMAFFMPFLWPNLVASLMDITLPELRASGNSLIMLCQAVGASIGVLLVYWLQPHLGLGDAILWVCIGAWSLTALSLIGLLVLIPENIEQQRRHMAYRSHLEARLTPPGTD